MRAFILLILLSLATAMRLNGQQPFLRDFWLNDNYLPVNIHALLQDSSGYLWLGTEAGLYRFTGKQFIKVPDRVKQPVTALAAASDKLWVGYKNGSVAQVESHFKNAVLDTIIHLNARILCMDAGISGDTLWVGTEDGFTVIFPDRHTCPVTGLSDNFIYALAHPSDGHFLAGTDDGINDITFGKNGKAEVKIRTMQNDLPDNIVRVICRQPATNLYWIGMQRGGIALYDARTHQVRTFPERANWIYGQVNDILPVSVDHAWVATREGYLVEVRIGKKQSLSVKACYYPGKQFKKLLCDRSGNIWCTTKNGLCMFTPEYLSALPLNAPYSLHLVTAMAFDRDNALWLAQDRKLYRLKPGDTCGLEPVFDAPAAISSLWPDQHAGIWIGTMGNGLWHKKENCKAERAAGNFPARTGNILSLAGTPGRLWISTLMGVDELACTGGSSALSEIRHHNKQSGVGSDYVYCLFPDHKGRIWMATDGAGICMWDQNRYHHWENSDPHSKVVYSIAEDARGDIWAGTYYKGLYHFSQNNWEAVTHERVSDANISAVAANATGQVLAVYDRCIDEWYPASRAFRHFNYRLEMGIDSTSDVLNCTAKDAAGNVYIPFEHGLLVFSNQGRAYDITPGIHITEVSALLKPVGDGKSVFAYNENYISFRFEGISMSNPERLRYRYKLDGFGNKWIYTSDESVTFPNLPPGNYTFHVQAALDDVFMLAREDIYSFRIDAPFWKKPWFIILSVIGLAGIVYLLIRARDKRQKELALLQQERMSFEYEHLKSQVNPHFLFNSLNTLTNLIEESSEAAVSYTERLADLYKNILAYRNKDLIFLGEEKEILATYLFVQQSRFGEALQVSFSVPEEVLSTKKIVPMALQMLVENAIKHNVVSLAQPLRIKITSDMEELVVSNPLQPKVSKEKGAGIALINIRKRYALLTDKPVLFGIHREAYVVRLPLL